MNQRKRVLFICGSINQTTQMHQIARAMGSIDAWYTPYYADGIVRIFQWLGLTETTILGRKLKNRTMSYLRLHDLPLDEGAKQGPYDLVVSCSDLIVPANIRRYPMVLVQEGMTDPEGLTYRLVRRLRFLPRWLASTSATGLSHAYRKFCVASEGYRDLFIRKGVRPETIEVTGIPNFDNCARFRRNDFPHRGYVLVCTSDLRETFHLENRRAFIRKATGIAGGRPLIFKLHPNEWVKRATREIGKYAPGAIIYTSGSAEEMIANCDVLITRWSSTAYVGLALGKETHSDFPIEELRRMTPVQNGNSAELIAEVCHRVLDEEGETEPAVKSGAVKIRRYVIPARRAWAAMFSRSGG